MTTALQGLGSVRTRDINTAISSQTSSPNSSSQLETPFAPSRLTNMDRSLLVRVLNRNLLHQREDSSLQSLSSDPLLTSLPAGSPLSYPNSATARVVADHLWSPLDPQTTASLEGQADRSPMTPAAELLSTCDSPTSVLLLAAGVCRADAMAPPPPTPASYSEPCTPSGSAEQVRKSCSASNLVQIHETVADLQLQPVLPAVTART